GKSLASRGWPQVTGHRDSVCLWATATGKNVLSFPLPGSSNAAEAMAFSPTGRLLATAEWEHRRLNNGDMERTWTVRLWETLSGQEVRRFAVPQGEVGSLAFAPDGRILACGGGDATILLWDLTGRAADHRIHQPPLTVGQLDALWADLAADAARAERALWT